MPLEGGVEEISWINWGLGKEVEDGSMRDHIGWVGVGGMEVESNERDILRGGISGLGRNLVQGKLLGIYKDESS